MPQKTVGFFFEHTPDEQRARLSALRRSEPRADETKIVKYLGAGVPVGVVMLIEKDYLCDPPKPIGEAILYSDGQWTWPATLSYYITNYHIELPQDFIEWMKSRDWQVPCNLEIEPEIPEGHIEL